jgi:uncharacterized delta-60 repeat protein
MAKTSRSPRSNDLVPHRSAMGWVSKCRMLRSRLRRGVPVVLGCWVVGLSVTPSSMAAPGELDPYFGQMGEFALQTGAACSGICPEFTGPVARALALQSDGKLLIADQSPESARNTGEAHSTILRVDDNGALDDTFGNGGLAPAPFEVQSLSAEANGDLVSTGLNDNYMASKEEVGIEHYTASGTPTTPVQWSIMPRDQEGLQILAFDSIIDGANRLLVFGSQIVPLVPDGDEPKLVRFLPTGALDTSFGSDGIASVQTLSKAETSASWPGAFALRKDGSLLVAATTYKTNRNREEIKAHAVIYQFTSNGKLNPQFGRGGMMALPNSSGYESLELAATPDGGFVLAAGESLSGSAIENRLVIVRYTKTGRPDNSFGRKGVATRTWSSQEAAFRRTDAKPFGVIPSAIAFDPRGRIVVAGSRKIFTFGPGSVENRFLARLTHSGFDCSFGSSGIVFGGANTSADAVAVQAHGHIVIAGKRNHEIVAALYKGGGAPRTCPGEHEGQGHKSDSRSRRSPVSPGSGGSIRRRASITFARASSRVRP